MAANWLRVWLRDTRTSVRSLSRSRKWAANLVLVVGTSVAINTIGLVLAYTALDRTPTGIRNAARIRRLAVSIPNVSGGLTERAVFSYPEVMALKTALGVSATTAFSAPDTQTILVGSRKSEAMLSLVDTAYFRVLGAPGSLTGAHRGGVSAIVGGHTALPAAISSSWARQTWADSTALGRIFSWRERVYVVREVEPSSFTGTELGATDIWIPLNASADVVVGNDWMSDKEMFPLTVLWRMPDDRGINGTPLDALQRLADNGPSDPRIAGVTTGPLSAGWGPNRRAVTILTRLMLGIGVLMLLSGCVDGVALLLMRSLIRRPEKALNVAFGATLADLRRQGVVEVVVLVAIAMIFSTIIGAVASSAAWRLMTAAARLPPLTLLGLSLFGSAAGSGAIGLGLLIVAYVEARKADNLDTIRGMQHTLPPKALTKIRWISAVQAGIAVVILLCAAVFLQSLRRADAINLGFDPRNVIAVTPEITGGTAQSVSALRRQSLQIARVRDVLRHDKRIEAVGLTTSIPFVSSTMMPVFFGDSLTDKRADLLNGPFVTVADTGFLHVLKIGRNQDSHSGPAQRIGLYITEGSALALWHQIALGNRCARIGSVKGPCIPFVGTLVDMHQRNLIEPPNTLNIIVPLSLVTDSNTPPRSLVIKAATTDEAAMRAIEQELMHAGLLGEYRTISLDEVLAAKTRRWRLVGTVLMVYGAVAVVLAAAGLSTIQRQLALTQRRRLCIEASLGARPGAVARAVIATGGTPVVIGAVAGIALYSQVTQLIAPLLFKTDPWDNGAMILVGGAIALASAAALLPPALYAARADPQELLRQL